MLGEVISDIHSEHLCPEIAVVACCIAATPYMVEIRGGVARWNLRVEQTDVVQLLLLESSRHIRGRYLLCRDMMPSEVETGGCQVLAQGICWLETDALQHTFLQFGWHWLASLSMASVMVEYLRDAGKRLVKLGWHFHEVTSYGCA